MHTCAAVNGTLVSSPRRRRFAALIAGAALVATALSGALSGPLSGQAGTPSIAASIDPALAHVRGSVGVIVQATGTSLRAAEAGTARLGGAVTRELPIVNGFAAKVPGDAITALAHVAGVRAITFDGPLHVQASTPSTILTPDDLPSVYRKVVSADKLASAGDNGRGVTVALIDTGVAALPDVAKRLVPVHPDALGLLSAPCMNFSDEPTCDDSYGHGTFVAGLIAGDGTSSRGKYVGIAPKAKILSIKLAGASGSADVSQTIAALEWVLAFRSTYNIKVLNLSLGTDSTQSYRIDPLNYAVEQVWKSGVTVVVAASNRGPGAATISKPGDDPYVITVGASFDAGTVKRDDDAIPNFTSHGPTAADGLTKPDVVAPGVHVVSLAAPGSTISTQFPSSMKAPYRRGSGTSFANGVVSGLVADMLSGNAALTPDRIKFALRTTAHPYAGPDVMTQGQGLVNGYAAMFSAPAGLANQNVAPGTGTGSLEASRGTVHVDLLGADGSATLIDGDSSVGLSLYDPMWIVDSTWTSVNWWTSPWAGNNWTGNNWTGNNWTGNNWTGNNWTGNNWTGSAWYGDWDN